MSWDDEDFEVPSPVPAHPTVANDKWEGEDEDDDIKDNWFDEDEEKPEVKPVEVKKKVSLKEKIAEKEKKKKEELEAKRLEREKALDPEEQLSEKLRRQQLQEDSDLALAKEAFGVGDDNKLDSFRPTNAEEFQEYAKLLADRITKHEKSPHFIPFIETLFRTVALNSEAEDIKKLGTALNTLANEKTKAQKGKKKSKNKKASLAVARDKDYDDYADLGPEYDDFM